MGAARELPRPPRGIDRVHHLKDRCYKIERMTVVEHSALVGSNGPDRGLAAALDLVLSELGFTRHDRAVTSSGWPCESGERTDLEVNYLIPERGAWACLGTSPAMARAVASRLAARLQNPIQVFTATVRCDRSLQCTIEDRVVRPDGKTSPGTFAQQLEDEVHGDWRELCDHKPYFAMTALIDAAIAAWIVGPVERRAALWTAPVSLGDRRLDDLARRIRLAVRAHLATIDGRPCVRVTTADGATTMSFLTADELARLEPAVSGLLVR
jgi:hypothetical protein